MGIPEKAAFPRRLELLTSNTGSLAPRCACRLPALTPHIGSRHSFLLTLSLTFYLSTTYIGRMSRKNDPGVLAIAPAAALANPIGTEREALYALVLQIQKADYEDDRPGLQHLYGELAPFTESKAKQSGTS